MIRKRTIPEKLSVAVVVLALALSVQGQKAERAAHPTRQRSVSQIESEIKSDPNNPRLFVALGLDYWDKNDYPHALEAFQHAVKVGPSSAEAHNWLGVALMEKADLPGATAEFRKAVVARCEVRQGLYKSGLGTGQEWRPCRIGAGI